VFGVRIEVVVLGGFGVATHTQRRILRHVTAQPSLSGSDPVDAAHPFALCPEHECFALVANLRSGQSLPDSVLEDAFDRERLRHRIAIVATPLPLRARPTCQVFSKYLIRGIRKEIKIRGARA
jgi:hypothetical protein